MVPALLAVKMFPDLMPPRSLSVHLTPDVPPMAHDVSLLEYKFVRRAYIEFHHPVIAAIKEVMYNAAIVKPFQIPEHTFVFIIGNPISFDFYLFPVTPVRSSEPMTFSSGQL